MMLMKNCNVGDFNMNNEVNEFKPYRFQKFKISIIAHDALENL